MCAPRLMMCDTGCTVNDQARARSLAGFSEDAGEGKDDGDSASRRSYADDDHDEGVDDEHDCEEELVELTEQDLLRMLDAQEPSLQASDRQTMFDD